MLQLEILSLVILAPHDAGQLMDTRDRIATVLGEHKGLVGLKGFPLVQLLNQDFISIGDLRTGRHVPAVVAVEHHEVSEMGAYIDSRAASGDVGVGARTILRVYLMGVLKDLRGVRNGVLA